MRTGTIKVATDNVEHVVNYELHNELQQALACRIAAVEARMQGETHTCVQATASKKDIKD